MRNTPKEKVSFSSGATTLIAKGTHVVGDIRFQGNLEIEGEVTGDVLADEGSDPRVRILDGGLVKGEIKVPSVVVNGTVQGDIHASKLVELAARAVVDGNVHYSLVEIEKGAQLNGSFVHQSSSMKSASVEPIKPQPQSAGGADSSIP